MEQEGGRREEGGCGDGGQKRFLEERENPPSARGAGLGGARNLFPNPQSPIPNLQSPISFFSFYVFMPSFELFFAYLFLPFSIHFCVIT